MSFNAKILDDLRYCADHFESNHDQALANLRQFAELLIGFGCAPVSPAPLTMAAVSPGGFRSPDSVGQGTISAPAESFEARAQGTPAQRVRQLLTHGVGASPFLGEMAHPRGRWVHGCLHSVLGYTYLPGPFSTRLERLA